MTIPPFPPTPTPQPIPQTTLQTRPTTPPPRIYHPEEGESDSEPTDYSDSDSRDSLVVPPTPTVVSQTSEFCVPLLNVVRVVSVSFCKKG